MSIFSETNKFYQKEKYKKIYQLIEMAAPTKNRREEILELLIKEADDEALDEVIKVLSRKIVDEAIDTVLADVTNPGVARNELRNIIFTSQKVKFEDTIDFIKKVNQGDLKSKLDGMLLKTGVTTFNEIKKWHPFLNACMEQLILVKNGLGTGISQAGHGEFMLALMGGTKPPAGDIRWGNKNIEVKSNGADLAPALAHGYPAIAKDYHKKTMQATPTETVFPTKQMTPGGCEKYIAKYGFEKWLEFMDNYLEIMFPTPNAVRNVKQFWNRMGRKRYSKNDFIKHYGWLVIKCMFDDDGIDAITYCDKTKKQYVTITSADSIPKEFGFIVSQYLIPR